MQIKSWQQQHQKILNNAKDCNNYLGIKSFVDKPFKIKIPQEFADLIQVDNPNDPILRQVLPSNKADLPYLGFSSEPLKDKQYSPVDGLIHKYHNRALLIVSSTCAVHCRYCFRQNFAYDNDIFKNMTKILAYLQNNASINEVILSGGDPLSLSDAKLANLIKQLVKIPHLKTLRIHTRTAVVIPSRLTQALADILINTPLKVVIVLHINHVQEMSVSFCVQIKKFYSLTLLNQSVLLAGVNDDKSVLITLSEYLFSQGILPYYLHQLDKVSGAEHFLVTDEKALQLHQNLKDNLSGYLVPRLVRDNNNYAKDWL